jgi:hypothetical protein
MLSALFSRFLKSEDVLESVPTDVSPVEYSLDTEWNEVESLPEGSSLLIDGTGRIFKLVNDRWIVANEIKDIRINTHY